MFASRTLSWARAWLAIFAATLSGCASTMTARATCRADLEEAEFFNGLHIFLPPKLRDIDVKRDGSNHSGTQWFVPMGCGEASASFRVFMLSDRQRSMMKWSEFILHAYRHDDANVRVVEGSERKRDITVIATFRDLPGEPKKHAYMRLVVVENKTYVVLFAVEDRHAWRKLRSDFARSARSMTVVPLYPYDPYDDY